MFLLGRLISEIIVFQGVVFTLVNAFSKAMRLSHCQQKEPVKDKNFTPIYL